MFCSEDTQTFVFCEIQILKSVASSLELLCNLSYTCLFLLNPKCCQSEMKLNISLLYDKHF